MILLNCAYGRGTGKTPMFETFQGMMTADRSKYVGNFLAYLFMIFVVVLAIILAVRCNPNHELVYGFIAFLFSEIYLIQFFIRKYIIQEKEYCKGIF